MPKQSTGAATAATGAIRRGRPSKPGAAPANQKAKSGTAPAKQKASRGRAVVEEVEDDDDDDDEEERQELSAARPDREGDADDGAADDVRMPAIPLALLTRVLHEFFDKKGTRVTRDANDAVAKYMDVFVREAIARAAAEKRSGFFEVEDLEKIAPQLLLDL